MKNSPPPTKTRKISSSQKIRCSWCGADPIYRAYHDNEWGRPILEPIALFEMLCLEGQQSGLSWITILKKRNEYRKMFFNFDPVKISQITDNQMLENLKNPGIVRYLLKLNAIKKNANAYLKLEKSNINFSNLIWSYTQHKQIAYDFTSSPPAATTSVESDKMSRNLKKLGFSFVGPTVCYAYMQACGLIWSHEPNCFLHNDYSSV